MIGELKAAWMGWGGSLMVHGVAIAACGFMMVRPPELGIDQASVSAEIQLMETPAASESEDQPPRETNQEPDPVAPVPLAEALLAPTVPPVPLQPLPEPQPLPAIRPSAAKREPSAAPSKRRSSEVPSLPSAASRGAREALPDYLRNPPPAYPESSRLAREEGVVILDVTVATSGKPTEVLLGRSSGHGTLDQAAVTAVRGWKFRPATANGIPVSSRVAVPVRFELH